mmetsp:Transcript_92474/g.160065  ORF Transcript_92474/g.160065 Transcript_92474/m.160065 type:complete len:87 (-) Transcript_92474:2216-2476(-)
MVVQVSGPTHHSLAEVVGHTQAGAGPTPVAAEAAAAAHHTAVVAAPSFAEPVAGPNWVVERNRTQAAVPVPAPENLSAVPEPESPR